MTFCIEWEQRYKENTHLSIWPWSDLVTYVMRYARPTGPDFRVLEIGCGAGANIPFFKHLGADYHAIDGSPTIVNTLHEQFPEYKDKIRVGDFTREIPFEGPFHLIVDRGSMTCNGTEAIRQALAMMHAHLVPGGKYVGIDWFSTQHSDYGKGEMLDPYTCNNLEEGHLAHTGRVHFSDRPHLEDLFSGFRLEILEHKTVKREIPADHHVLAVWHLVAVKP